MSHYGLVVLLGVVAGCIKRPRHIRMWMGVKYHVAGVMQKRNVKRQASQHETKVHATVHTRYTEYIHAFPNTIIHAAGHLSNLGSDHHHYRHHYLRRCPFQFLHPVPFPHQPRNLIV